MAPDTVYCGGSSGPYGNENKHLKEACLETDCFTSIAGLPEAKTQ